MNTVDIILKINRIIQNNGQLSKEISVTNSMGLLSQQARHLGNNTTTKHHTATWDLCFCDPLEEFYSFINNPTTTIFDLVACVTRGVGWIGNREETNDPSTLPTNEVTRRIEIVLERL